MKHLIIRNFGPISEVDINLKRINLIIGPQSSGKSTVLKIACFCDWMERQILLTQNPENYCKAQFFEPNLIGFHKLEGYLHSDSYIRYENDSISFEYDASKANKCSFSWGKGSSRWAYKRTKIAYIPSERNLVAAIPNWYQVSMNNNNIQDFMKEWEFARKSFSKNQPILGMPFSYRYNPKNMADYIVMPNGEELNLTNASSGLQSLIPLFVMVHYLTQEFFKEKHSKIEDTIIRENLTKVVEMECRDKSPEKQLEILNNLLTPYRADLYIEEPEAHIFPSTQKDFVYWLVYLLNSRKKHSCFIATHSPYIMTSFNNLIEAGERMSESVEISRKVNERFEKRQCINYNEVAAFSMNDGHIESIMNDEFKLISAEALDNASQEIANDFNFLLNL